MPPAAPAAWPQATLGQLGQHGRVVGSRDQRVQHRPAGGAQHVAGDRAQLGSRRPPRPWPAAGPHGSARRSAPCGRGADRAAPGSAWAPRTRVGPGRAQPADRSTPSRPHRAWARARCAGGGIQQPALEVVFQQVVHRPPVHPGGLHPDHGHAKAGQPITQQHQPCRGRPKRPRLLQPTPAGSGTPTVAVTLALSTSRPAQRSMSRSMAAPSRGRRQHNRPEEPQHAESEVRAPSNSPGVPEAPASSS